jgi:hypothetical protein
MTQYQSRGEADASHQRQNDHEATNPDYDRLIGLLAEHRIQDYRLDAEYGRILGG